MKYKLLKWFSACLCCLSHKNLLRLGHVLGVLYFLLIAKERNRAVDRMMKSFHNTKQEASELVKKSFINLSQNVLEILYMPRLKKDEFKYIKFEGLDILKREYAKNRGIVILTAHIGTWEWLAAGLVKAGFSVTALAKPQPDSQYTKLLDEYRAQVGVEIFARGAASELLAASRALKKGRILGFLADQDAGPGGAFIEFLGEVCSTPMGPAVFARKFMSPVVPAFIIRQKDGTHKIEIYEPIVYNDTGDSNADLFDFTKRMTKVIEDVIVEHPTQWIWFQKRWNTRPEERRSKSHTANIKKAEKTEKVEMKTKVEKHD